MALRGKEKAGRGRSGHCAGSGSAAPSAPDHHRARPPGPLV